MTIAAQAADQPLARERWQHRPLVVAIPDLDRPDYTAWRQELDERRAGVAERDMVVYVVTPTTARRNDEPLAEPRRQALVDGFALRPGERAEFILLGKDGTQKRRGPFPPSLKALFEQIDSMPMRQREMRRSQ
jgi:hypothetical protein